MNAQLTIAELKARLRIDEAWRLLHLPGEPAKCCKSPFRPDERHASFSVYGDGTRAKDHATGETFDVVDFIAKALDADTAGAVRWLRERLGECREIPKVQPRREESWKVKPWPVMRGGSADELAELARLRGLPVSAVEMASERGHVLFGTQWRVPFWCVTDAARRCAELRTMSGDLWPGFREVPPRKAHCYGDKSWPIGLMESEPFPFVLLLEGVGDFLAAFAVIENESRESDVAPVACLGASVRLAPEVVSRLAQKRVRIIPQMDAPGQRAAREWALCLRSAGAVVDAFSLAGIRDGAGVQIKDLGDVFAKASAASIRANPQIMEVCPR
jgi:hypothetical protein